MSLQWHMKERLEALTESLKNEAGQVQVYAGDVS